MRASPILNREGGGGVVVGEMRGGENKLFLILGQEMIFLKNHANIMSSACSNNEFCFCNYLSAVMLVEQESW